MANVRSRTPIPPHHRPDNAAPLQRESGGRHDHRRRDPWQHMADTYAWVENHCVPHDSRGKKTEKWVLEQQILYHGHPKPWEGLIFMYDDEVRRRMKDEEEIQQFLAQKDKRKARIIDEKIKQIENRIRHRREMEKQRIAAERFRAAAEHTERQRHERAKADQATREAWTRYEKGWEDIARCSPGPISFSAIPWPLISKPTPDRLDQITATEIGMFLFSPLHSEGHNTKERIRRAQLIWHPDRFQKILRRVVFSDQSLVEAGAGLVARYLNDLMAREMGKARR
ncbi:hypothetical protein B0H19DRAFT_977174 [Mycena capillaripes]|nr:hypothetical protein B0H19DRAFT_977174 [Mycena capillaripes]